MVGSGNGSGFFQGFVSGALGSLASSSWTAVLGKHTASTLGGMIAFGALSSGIGAELAGGNFWQGAITGGIVAGLNHTMHKLGGKRIKVDKKTRKAFKKMVREKDYEGAFELVNSKYNLDAEIEGKYTMSYVDSDDFSGVTKGDAFKIQKVTISIGTFRKHVGTFIRVVHHEFIHVYQRAILGMQGSLSSHMVRAFLAYHDTLFNDKLPYAPYYEMEGYWNRAKDYFNYFKNRPTLITKYNSQYKDYINANF